MSENPYDPPQVETETVRKSKPASSHGLSWIVVPTAVAAVFGALTMKPLFHWFGEPLEHAAMAAVVGLVIGLILRAVRAAQS